MDANERAAPLTAIQGLWVGGDLPPIAQLSIASFLAHGHPYHLYVYDRPANTPEGCELKDAAEILPRKDAYHPLACFSDWFRFELLLKRGGTYMDIDMVCLRPYHPQGTLLGATQDEDPKEDLQFNGAVMHVPRGKARVPLLFWSLLARYPWWLAIFDPRHFLRRHRIDRPFGEPLNPTAKPGFATWWRETFDRGKFRSIAARRLHRTSYQWLGNRYQRWIARQRPARDLFYPVPWDEWGSFYDDTYKGVDNPFPSSVAVHLWRDAPLLKGMPSAEDERISPHSFFAKMWERHIGDGRY